MAMVIYPVHFSFHLSSNFLFSPVFAAYLHCFLLSLVKIFYLYCALRKWFVISVLSCCCRDEFHNYNFYLIIDYSKIKIYTLQTVDKKILRTSTMTNKPVNIFMKVNLNVAKNKNFCQFRVKNNHHKQVLAFFVYSVMFKLHLKIYIMINHKP